MSKTDSGNTELLAVLTRIAVALETRGIPVGHNDDAARQALQDKRDTVLKPSANDVKKATPPVSEPEKEAAALPLTYEKDIKPIAQSVLSTKGREALLKLLEAFQVESATKLAPAVFEEFRVAAKKVLDS